MLIPALLISSMGMSQYVIIDQEQVKNCNGDLTTTITNNMDLTSYQQKEIKLLEERYYQDIASIEDEYKMNSDVYMNKLRVLHEKYVVELRKHLTLEQYAVYLLNNRDNQYYDSEYKEESVKLEREADGDVFYEDQYGEIEIEDDKFIVKNEVTDTYLKVTPKKIVWEDEVNDKKVKIKEDKVIVKEEGNRTVIENDEADVEGPYFEIEIDDVEQTASTK